MVFFWAHPCWLLKMSCLVCVDGDLDIGLARRPENIPMIREGHADLRRYPRPRPAISSPVVGEMIGVVTCEFGR